MELVPEAGLLELVGNSYSSYAGPRDTPRRRVWYSFQPAEEDPAQKPLVLLFNGGPGGPALGLLGFSIGHYTFDADFTDGAAYVDNPHRWTDFANLIYVDQPGTGFSYHLPRTDGTSPALGFDTYADAADYLRVLLRFIARHPQLATAPIIITGESYGGMRAAHMTAIMLDYPSLIADGTYQDAELYDEIVAFLATRRSDLDPTAWTPADIAEVFSHQILIQPYLTGRQSAYAYTWDEVPGCIPDGDEAECHQSPDAVLAVIQHLADVVTDPELLTAIHRCDFESIEWLRAEQRVGAYARDEGSSLALDMSRLEAVLGTPEPGDRYYVFMNWETRIGLDMFDNFTHGETALRSLHEIPTFITAAAYDLFFNPDFLTQALEQYDQVLEALTVSSTTPSGAERPGEIDLVFAPGLPYGSGTRTIRFPPYLAGHSVSHTQPGELLADVEAWLGVPGD